MFKKFTAVIAATTMMIVGLTAMPASATAASNAGAVKPTSWSLNYSSPEGVLSAATSTANVPAGATSMDSYMAIRFGNTYVQSLAGHEIVVDWNETFPNGVTWNSGSYDPTKPYKYVRGEGGGGYYPLWDDVNVVTNNTTPGEPANSSVFTVPASVSEITQSYQYFSVTLGLSQDHNPLRAGAYTIAPTLYDRTAGTPITISSTEDANGAYTTSSWYWVDGQGAFEESVPANTRLDQRLTTCVLASSLTEGNVLTLDRIKDGTNLGGSQWGDSIQKKGTQDHAGSFSPNWTVPTAVASENWTGIRVSSMITADNTGSSTAIPTPSFDLIVRDTSAGDAQLEASCAAQTPAKPTFRLTSTSGATITWAKNSDDTNVQYWNRKTTYKWSLYKQSDLTTPVMVRSAENPSLTDGTYSENINFRDDNWMSIPVDLDTNYVIKMAATNEGDYIESSLSPASDPSMLSTPAAPAAPTLDIVSRTSFTVTWNKVASDVESGGMCGGSNCRTVEYNYELYKASAPTVIVASGSLYGSTLTGSSYSKTLSDLMSGPPMWNSVYIDANVDYFIKISAYDYQLGLESDMSAASAADQLTGPAAPAKPTIDRISVMDVQASFTARAGELGTNGFSYSAKVYNSSDTAFANPVGSGGCGSPSPTSTAYTCMITSMGMSGFNAPDTFKVRIFAEKNQLLSLGSPASDPVIGGIAGVSVTAPSGDTSAGQAKLITSTIPALLTTNNGSVARMIVDGVGNYYAWTTEAGTASESKFALRKLKSDFTGTESSFGTNGKVVYVSDNATGGEAPNAWTNRPNLPSVSFFSGASKLAVFTSLNNCPPQLDSNYVPCNVSPRYTFEMSESTVGGAFSTPINMDAAIAEFCTANVGEGFGNVHDVSIYGFEGLQALSRPAASLSCNGYDQDAMVSTYQSFLVTVAADGVITKLTELNAFNSTQNYLIGTRVSSNPSATGDQVAAVVAVIRSKRTGNVNSNIDRSVIRVKADGSVTETADAFSIPNLPEQLPTMASIFAPAGPVYALYSASGQNKLMTLDVNSGVFGAATNIVIDVPNPSGSSSLSFPSNSAPVVNGKIAFTRRDFGMTQAVAPMWYNVSTGATVTGEMVRYTTAGNVLNFSTIDPSGNLRFLYTPAVSFTDQNPLKHSLISWPNVRDAVAVPTPTVSMPGIAFSLNAGGGTFTIQGTNFDVTTAAKKIKGFRFGVSQTVVAPSSKTATSLSVKIPAGVAGNTPVTLVYGTDSTLMAGSVTYVGTTKLAQPVNMTVTTTAAVTGDPDREITVEMGAVSPVQAGIPGNAVVSATPSTVCSIVDGRVRFLANGLCTVKALKVGNGWLADGVDTATISVRKADSVTAGFGPGDLPSEVLERDEAIAPLITLASGRTDYTMVEEDTDICEITDTKMIWFKAGNEDCVITITTSDTNAVWASTSYTWTIPVLPPAGGAGSPLLVRNDNVMVKLPGLGVKWDQKKNQVFFITRVKWVGPVQAKMTFVDDQGDDNVENDVTHTCLSNFGILKKTTLPKNGEPFIISSGAMCTDTKGESGAKLTTVEKSAQTAAYAALKRVVARNSGNLESTNVQFTYRRETHRSSNYNEIVGGRLATKTWSAPMFAKLFFRAIDKVSASLPTGITAAVSATADGAFLPTIALDSKRTDYTVTSADTDKCEVLADGRIWAKVVGENCVLTIGTGINTVWAGIGYTWTVPMVAAVGADAASAAIAPSNGLPALAGPLALIWTQSKSTVALKLTSRNVGLVTAKMTFTGLDNLPYTCEVKFGSAKKVATTSIFPFKVQTGPSFCTYTTGMTTAQKAAQAVAYAKFKALVTARKPGLGQGVIPIEIAYKFEQHSAATGLLLDGQILNTVVDKPWSATTHFKLNFRATYN